MGGKDYHIRARVRRRVAGNEVFIMTEMDTKVVDGILELADNLHRELSSAEKHYVSCPYEIPEESLINRMLLSKQHEYTVFLTGVKRLLEIK